MGRRMAITLRDWEMEQFFGKQKKKKSKHVGSVFTDEQDLLQTLINLHSPHGIELDPMFNKGNFYKTIPKPKYYSDLLPLNDYVPMADATNLPYHDSSINSMILDPPFLFNIHGVNGIQGKYYSSKTHGIFKNFDELKVTYKGLIKEAYRILKHNGVLIFKCQDYTDSKTDLTHCYVWEWAREQGFYIKDLAILYISKGKISNGNTTQRHLRKHHTYFYVMIKKRKIKDVE